MIAVVIIVWSGRTRRRRRQALAAMAWQNLMAATAAHPGAYLCFVERVYQRARRGTKAVIVWAGTDLRQDTWFWHFNPAAGATLLVYGSAGYGPHNHNPAVFYVDVGGVLAGAPPGAQQAWLRTQQAATRR
ncbi:hypothetical protein [Actinoplanes sp. NPDC051859]|uniref:hypothetical protein n=1 Tax=Actinoplanes sp. NPDC051859 TaxID=3363909 RepID=UPI003788350C